MAQGQAGAVCPIGPQPDRASSTGRPLPGRPAGRQASTLGSIDRAIASSFSSYVLIHQLAGEVLGRRRPCRSGRGPSQAEQDGLGLALGLAAQGLVDGGADGVGGFRRRDDAFGAGELHAGLEACRPAA